MSELQALAAGVCVCAVRTPTLPPATHTNCYALGERSVFVIDPASPFESEQHALEQALIAHGEVRAIVLSHHHHDHISGAVALQRALAARGQHVPIWAHAQTAALLEDTLRVDGLLTEGDVLHADDGHAWTVCHTPGHAPGHLVFHDPQTGVIVAGDMVAGVGTILIDPSDGDLGQYLASLQRMDGLKPRWLLPSHGPVLTEARAVLGFYVAHRHQRTAQIGEVLRSAGPLSAEAIAAQVYPELQGTDFVWLASRQILSHLRWMAHEGLASPCDRGVEAGPWRVR